MNRFLLIAVTLAALAVPVLSAAQSRPPAQSGVSVYGGAGELTLGRSDLEVRHALGGEGGVRFPLSDRVRIDVSIGQFRNHVAATYFDVPISSPTALLGRAERLDQRTDRTTSTADVVVMRTGGTGRLRAAAGGGVGLIVLGRTFRQTLSGCSAGTTQFCGGETGTDSTRSSGTGVGLGTVDVRLTPRLAVYGSGRVVLVLRDVASSGVRVTAGVRMSF
jgi:opacity protein-like surface antigen